MNRLARQSNELLTFFFLLGHFEDSYCRLFPAAHIIHSVQVIKSKCGILLITRRDGQRFLNIQSLVKMGKFEEFMQPLQTPVLFLCCCFTLASGCDTPSFSPCGSFPVGVLFCDSTPTLPPTPLPKKHPENKQLGARRLAWHCGLLCRYYKMETRAAGDLS